MPFQFELLKKDPSGARLGRLTTPHGTIDTPAFMPVGTAATVKGLTQVALEELGAQIILANTYHLFLRPGHELVCELGGLHDFMAWPRPILTDSGGFQVFSLAGLRKVTDEGVTFRSHLDGSEHFLSPERVVAVELALGADIIMVLDECIAAPASYEQAQDAARRTLAWARRSKEFFARDGNSERQMLSAIVQGGTHADLRRECADALVAMEFPAYAIGGLAVGEPHDVTCAITALVAARLPAEKPRYLMGVGRPEQIADYVMRGVDMMDCVMPTRNARNGSLFTSNGPISIKNAKFARDPRPVDEQCACPVCRRHSRAYLRHLFLSNEIVGAILNTCHNVHFYLDLMAKIREAISFGNLAELHSGLQARPAER
jgi:queuine tRNA-ribosyltransferase